MNDHILIVDDELSIRRLLSVALVRTGRTIVEADCAKAALSALSQSVPQLVLLDLGLPDRDGLELIGAFRAKAVPIIVLTARDASTEKVAALDLGADDYVTKPFDTEELLARVRTCLRRADHGQGQARRMDVGSVTIDLDAHGVSKNGIDVKLTPKEFDLLAALAHHPGKVLTHTHLLREVWGQAHTDHIEYLRVTVRSLRKKLEDDPGAPVLIQNETGVGYRLKDSKELA